MSDIFDIIGFANIIRLHAWLCVSSNTFLFSCIDLWFVVFLHFCHRVFSLFVFVFRSVYLSLYLHQDDLQLLGWPPLPPTSSLQLDHHHIVEWPHIKILILVGYVVHAQILDHLTTYLTTYLWLYSLWLMLWAYSWWTWGAAHRCCTLGNTFSINTIMNHPFTLKMAYVLYFVV